MSIFRRLFKKRSKGMTLVETLVSLVILSLAVIVVARVTASKVDETANVDSQYSIINADAIFSDIYHDFHACSELLINKDDVSGKCSISFNLGSEGMSFYEYVPDTGYFYKNGVSQFKCTSFSVTGTKENILVFMKLENEKRLEMDIFR